MQSFSVVESVYLDNSVAQGTSSSTVEDEESKPVDKARYPDINPPHREQDEEIKQSCVLGVSDPESSFVFVKREPPQIDPSIQNLPSYPRYPRISENEFKDAPPPDELEVEDILDFVDEP